MRGSVQAEIETQLGSEILRVPSVSGGCISEAFRCQLQDGRDVFVKVHSRIDSLQDEERVGPWLYQITRNTITDHYRRRRIDSAPLEALDVMLATTDLSYELLEDGSILIRDNGGAAAERQSENPDQ